ncbi:MAG: hypothetical protein HOV68_19675, partial [Streptomycetaceae bacterium]|nr:hypothetical protein [Streptomycetaceae bacterium]
MDEADQGPGPRDPEIPHQATDEDAPHGASAVFAESAPEEPDWTRSLTTISVVAPRPRPPVEQADEGGTASEETAEEASAETSEPISQPISQP